MKGRKPAGNENEIKLALPDAATGRRLLRQAGFRVVKSRVFEINTVFDTAGHAIVNSGRLLRLRQVNRRGTLTYKGVPAAGGRHKSREEIESTVDDPAAAAIILERLGYQRIFRYEKYRTEFQRPGERGIATVDETPIGAFLELEGSPRWVDRAARALGFSAAGYITRSYGSLYFESCSARGVTPTNMVFDHPPKR
jgi:adenylate cyclase class 2